MSDFSDELDVMVAECTGTLCVSIGLQPAAGGPATFNAATGLDVAAAPPDPITVNAVRSERVSADTGFGGGKARVTEVTYRVSAADLALAGSWVPVEGDSVIDGGSHPITNVGREAMDKVVVIVVRTQG